MKQFQILDKRAAFLFQSRIIDKDFVRNVLIPAEVPVKSLYLDGVDLAIEDANEFGYWAIECNLCHKEHVMEIDWLDCKCDCGCYIQSPFEVIEKFAFAK